MLALINLLQLIEIMGDAQYPLKLFLRVVIVNLETMKLLIFINVIYLILGRNIYD